MAQCGAIVVSTVTNWHFFTKLMGPWLLLPIKLSVTGAFCTVFKYRHSLRLPCVLKVKKRVEFQGYNWRTAVFLFLWFNVINKTNYLSVKDVLHYERHADCLQLLPSTGQ